MAYRPPPTRSGRKRGRSSLRLADEFGKSRAAPAALATLGAAAARSAEWPIAREAYQILATRYAGKRSARRRGSIRRRRCCARGAVPEARQRLEAS